MIKRGKNKIFKMNDFLKLNIKNILEINFFIVFLFTFLISINLFNLSYNLNILSEVHGPFYLDIAKGFHVNKFLSNYYNLIPESNVYTFQIGISLIHYIGIFLLGYDYWFLIPILLCSFLWSYCYIYFLKFINSFEIRSNFFLFTCLLCFYLQPYNLNQIATYSNEMIYFPLSILVFLYFHENVSNKNIIYKNNKFLLIILIPLVLLGIFFRFHHLIFISSIFFSYLHLKKQRIEILIFFILFFFFNFFIILQILLNDNKNIINTLFIFINYLTDYIYNENIFKTTVLAGMNVSVDNTNYFSLAKINDGLNVFSGHFILNKFFLSEIIIFIFNLILMLISLKGIQLANSIFLKRFSYYFIFFSVVFLYILPPNELNYYLPTSFIIIFSQIYFLKYLLKKNFNKFIIIFSSIFFMCVLYLIIGGTFFSNKLEVHNNRDNLEELELFKINHFTEKNSIVLKTDELTFPSNLSKQLNTRFCNSIIEACMNLKNPRDLDYITNVNKQNIEFIYLFGRDHGYVNKEFEESKINLLKSIDKMNYNYDYSIINTSRYLILIIKII